MLDFAFAIAAGFAGGYVYGSERARQEARRRLSAAPEPLRRATQGMASAAGSSAQRLAGVVSTAPVPDRLKQAASGATSTAQTAAEQAGQAVTPGPEIARPSAGEVATRPAEPLPRVEPEAPSA